MNLILFFGFVSANIERLKMKYADKIIGKFISRKLFVLLIAVGLFIYDPLNFNGNTLVFVFCVFLGVETVSKFSPNRSE